MTPQEFSSAGGKSLKGTPQAKERARKGGLAAAAKRKLEGETLSARSPFIAKKEAQGKIRPTDAPFGTDAYAENQRRIRESMPKVSSEEAHAQARRVLRHAQEYDEAADSRVEYDKKQKWTPTPDLD